MPSDSRTSTDDKVVIEPNDEGQPVARGAWTPDEDETLRKSFAKGLPDHAIALLLPARSERACTIHRHKLDLVNYPRATRTKTPDDVKKLRSNHSALVEVLEDVRRMVRNRANPHDLTEYINTSLKLHR